jgi:N-acetylglucosamine-6-sulfatase
LLPRPRPGAARVALVPVVLLLCLGLFLPARSADCAGRPSLSTAATPDTQPAVHDDRPNVLLITADDMRADDLRFMPFVRGEFRRRGVTFEDALSPYPLCCPARAQIVTGQYNHNNGVLGNTWPSGGYWALRDRDNTLPVWLSREGYLTGFVGKYMNEYGRRPQTLSESDDPLKCRDTYEVPPGWRHWYAGVSSIYAYTHVLLNVDTPATEPHPVFVGQYQTDYFSDVTTDLIRRYHRADRPFFIWASHLAPHIWGDDVGDWGPPLPAPRDRGLHDRLTLPRSASYRAALNAPPTDKFGPMRGLPPVSLPAVLDAHRRRAESLRSLDRAVKAAVDQLKRSREYADTVIIFTSDNGFMLGEHRYVGKDRPYEPALRVPMIVNARDIAERYAPGHDGGRLTVPDTVTMTDIAATVVGVTGTRPGRTLDGIDVTRPAQNPDHRGGDRVVLLESGPNEDAPLGSRQFVGVRTDRWTWLAWNWAATGVRHGPGELYDRRAVPSQNRNLTEPSPVRRRLRDLAVQMRDCAGSACVRSMR